MAGDDLFSVLHCRNYSTVVCASIYRDEKSYVHNKVIAFLTNELVRDVGVR